MLSSKNLGVVWFQTPKAANPELYEAFCSLDTETPIDNSSDIRK